MNPPLEFYVMASSYNTYGGHATLSLLADFILAEAPEFGAGVTELTVHFNFPHFGPPRSTLERDYDEFHANLRTLPKVVFRRKRGKAVIDIASQLLDGKDLEGPTKLSVSLFRSGFGETVTALKLLRPRLTSKDMFSLDALLDHCRGREVKLPSSDEALAPFKSEVDRREAELRGRSSPWERLDVDWRDFHRDARRILDDPFFWEEGNDFSPHGNDTGSDVLSDYRRWLQRHPSDDPLRFYQNLMARWTFAEDATDPLIRSAMDEAAVALAFAELKLMRADCRPSVAQLAKNAIRRQREEAFNAEGWPHREDRLKSLELIESKLQTGG
jgi:uncharacterized protein YfeS